MQILPGLSSLIDEFDVFFVDIYGVIHDGEQVYPGVLNCLENIRAHKKELLFLTNFPYRAHTIIEGLDTFGISRSLYQQVMSSGEEVYEALREPKGSFFSRLGDKCYFIGPSNVNLIEGLSFERVMSIDSADFIIVTGPDDWHHELAEYEDVLTSAAQRQLPLVCANPDPEGFARGHKHIEAGAIARFYHRLGGRVKTFGKPDQHYIFKAISFYKDIPLERILIIGDSLGVDMMSGITSGLQTAFIPTGLHEKEFDVESGNAPPREMLEPLVRRFHVKPTFVLPGFIW